MRKSRHEVINELMGDDNNRCCPRSGCHCKTVIHNGFDAESEKFVCSKCGQGWSVGYEVKLCVRVEGTPTNPV